MIDTLKLAKNLQSAGMSTAQAEGIAEALRDAQSDYITKADLDAAVSKLEAKISEAKFQMVWGFGIILLAQIVSHFWK